jgi:tripartite-type tricarboxylate transporter receptor subunit TctC
VTFGPLVNRVPYDVEQDLAPVANLALAPFALVTLPSFAGAADARNFVAAVWRADPAARHPGGVAALGSPALPAVRPALAERARRTHDGGPGTGGGGGSWTTW